VFARDFAGDGEPESAAVGAAGNERFEQRVREFGGHAAAVVVDVDAQREPRGAIADAQVALDARAQRERVRPLRARCARG
jgi:hypothetical protein